MHGPSLTLHGQQAGGWAAGEQLRPDKGVTLQGDTKTYSGIPEEVSCTTTKS